MGKSNLNSLSLLSSHLLLFSLLAVCNLFLSATSSTDHVLIQNPLQGLACSLVNCGEGSCVSSNTSALGFDCECKSGWQKIQIGAFTYPSCLIPNCTINFDCSNESPPAPPPPAVPPPPLNPSDHCGLVWCGDGSCIANNTGHTCQCSSGAENLLGNPAFACLKACSLGGDCSGLGILLFGPPPSPPPPPTNSGNGPTQLASNGSSKLGTLAIILLVAATMQTWF